MTEMASFSKVLYKFSWIVIFSPYTYSMTFFTMQVFEFVQYKVDSFWIFFIIYYNNNTGLYV